MACVYAPIKDDKTAAEIIARYKVAKRKLFPAAPANVVKPRPPVLPVAVVHKPVEYTAEQAAGFMARAHRAIEDKTEAPIILAAKIIEACCEAADITLTEFRSERRMKRIVHARQAYYYIARNHTRASYPVIGKLAGGRDHATVLHGIRQSERAINDDASPLGRVIRHAIAILEDSK